MSTQRPTIGAEARDHTGTRYAKRLRKAGQLPAVVYGHKQAPSHISVNAEALREILHSHAHLIDVKVGDGIESCLVKDIQWDHLGTTIVHVDFARVDLTEKVTVSVNIELVGEAVGLKEAHTIMYHPLQTIDIECLATNIPDDIQIDVSELNVGDTLTAAELKLAEGVTCVLDPDTVIAAVRVTAAEEEDVDEAEAGAGEPEVVGKKEESADQAAE